MTSTPAPRDQPARTGALVGLIGAGAGGRAFVDHAGTAVALPRPVRRLAATDAAVAALLLGVGADLAGTCNLAGLDGAAPEGLADLGPAGRPDPAALAALRPDAIIVAVRERAYDLPDPGLLAVLRRVAPVVGMDPGRPRAAAADLRALIGSVSPDRPVPPRRRPSVPPRGARAVEPPATRPDLW